MFRFTKLIAIIFVEHVTQANTCRVHKEKPLDYYCKDCSKSICMDCLMVGGEKSCKNHNVVSMQEVVCIVLLDFITQTSLWSKVFAVI